MQSTRDLDPEIRTSVVIPAFKAWFTLPLVVGALEPQIGSARGRRG